MKTYHFKRLEKLCAFLDKLPRKKFHFGHVRCGAVGCAIGWTPEALPRASKTLPKPSEWNFYRNGAKLFGMHQNTALDLFAPSAQSGVHPSLRDLSDTTTPKKVSAMLRKFMRLVKAGKIQP